MNGQAIPAAYLFHLYVCDKEISWPHHIGETHQPNWVVYVYRNLQEITFRLMNVIPERIIFISRGITVFIQWITNKWPLYSVQCVHVFSNFLSNRPFSSHVEYNSGFSITRDLRHFGRLRGAVIIPYRRSGQPISLITITTLGCVIPQKSRDRTYITVKARNHIQHYLVHRLCPD